MYNHKPNRSQWTEPVYLSFILTSSQFWNKIIPHESRQDIVSLALYSCFRGVTLIILRCFMGLKRPYLCSFQGAYFTWQEPPYHKLASSHLSWRTTDYQQAGRDTYHGYRAQCSAQPESLDVEAKFPIQTNSTRHLEWTTEWDLASLSHGKKQIKECQFSE